MASADSSTTRPKGLDIGATVSERTRPPDVVCWCVSDRAKCIGRRTRPSFGHAQVACATHTTTAAVVAKSDL